MMEGDETKTCQNCKREIPAVNFTIHTVHCARNIRVCPVCKEPVPLADLDEHHDKLHKLLPCKQCGESVCGTDLEDHIRDSCGHTIKSCRFCELELPRRKLPAHEGYCGVRTEQCPECREWVMIKYRQLHLDSNHGFLRLDDDPIPQPKKDPPRANIPKTYNTPKPTNVMPSTSNGLRPVKTTNLDQERASTDVIQLNGPSNSGYGPSHSGIRNGEYSNGGGVAGGASAHKVLNSVPKPSLKRTNDQPQINTAVAATDKLNKDLSVSRGAVKKRPAPKPPAREPPAPDPKRELPYQRAVQRHQDEEKRRQEINAYNLAMGLPPVLSPAAKLEKLRKMDALQNSEVVDTDYKNRLQGRVWMPRDVPTGNTLGSETTSDQNNQNLAVERRRIDKSNRPHRDNITGATGTRPMREDLSNLTPMSPQEFMERFNELQLRKETQRDGERRSERNNSSGDRFSEIKSSLRELRRGLNEVTAPYNSSNSSSSGHHNGEVRERRRSPRGDTAPDRQPAASGDGDGYGDAHEDAELRLPCEFCAAPVPAHDLVRHQTGCRPDLAQLRPRSESPRPRSGAGAGPAAGPPPALVPSDDPVIPCEFCMESLPIYLITEHQERCRREADILYAD